MSSLNVPPADPGNAIIAHTLHWLAVLLEIDEGDPEKIAAYRQAAYTVRTLEQQVAAVVRASGASGLEGLGFTPAIAAMIADWIRTGHLPVIEKETQQRAGLWPALTRALCKTLGIEPAERRTERKNKRDGFDMASARRMPRGAIHRQVWESWN